jgi:hypothetical protein
LPITQLRIPDRLYFGKAQTATVPVFDENGRMKIDLRPLVGVGAEEMAFKEAADLIFKLGGILGRYPQISDRIAFQLGVRLVMETDDDAD